VSRRSLSITLAIVALVAVLGPTCLPGQTEEGADIVRRLKSKVDPEYPELAHRMKIAGTVKIKIVVNPNGLVKEARVVGGHPVLANAALDAVRKWRFEPAPAEATGVIDFKFAPQ